MSINRYLVLAIVSMVSVSVLFPSEGGAEDLPEGENPSLESESEKLKALSEKLEKSLDSYAKTKIKFISGDSSDLEEPLKTYVQTIEARLIEYLNRHVKDADEESLLTGVYVHLRINSNGSVSDTRIVNSTLAAGEAQRLNKLLMHSGPFGPFPQAIVDEGYVTIVLNRVLSCEQ